MKVFETLLNDNLGLAEGGKIHTSYFQGSRKKDRCYIKQVL